MGELADAPDAPTNRARIDAAYNEVWSGAHAVREVSYTGQSACLASADKDMDAAMDRFITWLMGYWGRDGWTIEESGIDDDLSEDVLEGWKQAVGALRACGIPAFGRADGE